MKINSNMNHPNEIVSRPTEIVANRFLVKCSAIKVGQDTSILVAVQDVVEGAFRMKYFVEPEKAASFINLLKSA